MRNVLSIPSHLVYIFCVHQNDIMVACESCEGMSFGMRTPPHDFVPDVRRAKNLVQHQLNEVAHSRVAMEVKGTSRFKHSVKISEPGCHHHQVSYYIVCSYA